MLILGLNFGTHDPAAALVCDGVPVAMLAQERISRIKYAPPEGPARAAEWCLQHAGAKPQDIDAIAIGWDHSLFPRAQRQNDPPRSVIGALPAGFAELPLLPPVYRIRHHLAHAASAFYCSGFDRAAVLIVDGRGERESASLGVASEAGIVLSRQIPVHDSLGYLYRAASHYAGLGKVGSRGAEGKLMGLAAYGVPGQEMPMRVTADGPVLRAELAAPDQAGRHLNHEGRLRAWFAESCFPYAEALTDEVMAYAQFAASVQSVVEQAIVALATSLRQQTGQSRLVLAGGVALNCTANGVLADRQIFQDMFVPPISADEGVSLGAALEAYRQICGDKAGPTAFPRMRNAFLGPEYSTAQCREALDEAGLPVREVTDDVLVHEVAQHLAAGKIVAWFQGRAEIGPRALGARSILADPRDRSLLSRLNRLKGREIWRPVAPSVLAEEFSTYFAGSFQSPFMNVATQVRPEVRARVPAVVHVDGSARPQAIVRDDAPLYWSLVDQFRQITGIPLVVNTSFNLGHEPIVHTPTQAIRSFLAGGFDVLALGNHLVGRAECPWPVQR
jgi:carbamoyltransferase